MCDKIIIKNLRCGKSVIESISTWLGKDPGDRSKPNIPGTAPSVGTSVNTPCRHDKKHTYLHSGLVQAGHSFVKTGYMKSAVAMPYSQSCTECYSGGCPHT